MDRLTYGTIIETGTQSYRLAHVLAAALGEDVGVTVGAADGG